MAFNSHQRLRTHEWMDDPDVDPRDLARSLRFIRGVNRVLGYTRASLQHLRRFAQAWTPAQRVTLLDVATGSADIPVALRAWSVKRAFDLQILALDLHSATLAEASRRVSGDPGVALLRADALRLPLADRSVDYAHTAMFLHHLDDEQIVTVLREMNRVARRGVIVADLLRHRRAYAWTWLMTLATPRIIRHDARVSVAQALTRREIEQLGQRAGLTYCRFHQHFAHRFVYAGEKRYAGSVHG